MDSLPLGLVLLSAFCHGIWNFLAKGGGDKESFMLLLNISSLLLFLPIFFLLLPEIYFPRNILSYLIISALAEALYFLSLGKAYEDGDLSLVYPIARSSPILVALAAFLFLGEKISLIGLVSICLIFIGIYVLHLEGFSRKCLVAPLRQINSKPSGYALLSALGTTIYSLMDKIGVTLVDPILYSFWLTFFETGMLLVAVIYLKGTRIISNELSGNITRISISGLLMKGGYVMFLFAMSLAQVSYILALRQISVVLGALLGIVFLKESYNRVRILGSIFIFIGCYILGVFA